MLMIRVINLKIQNKIHQNHHMIHHIIQLKKERDLTLLKKMVRHIREYQRETIQ